ncbi:hypothetical protein Tco_1087736 [Tanacetum coccineum]
MMSSPLFRSYNDIVRLLLDIVHKLGCMNIIDGGTITLPTIVVIGDQSSAISLPCGIHTRVLLIIRLQHHSDSDLELHLRIESSRSDMSQLRRRRQFPDAVTIRIATASLYDCDPVSTHC